MAGQQQIDNRSQASHCPPRMPDQQMRIRWFRQVERMMSHEYTHQTRWKSGKVVNQSLELRLRDPAALYGHEMSAVRPDDRDLIVDQNRFEILCDKPAIVFQPFGPAPPKIIEGQVMVPRNDDLRLGKLLQKIASFCKLLSPSVLHQVAGNHQNVRANRG